MYFLKEKQQNWSHLDYKFIYPVMGIDKYQ